MQYQITQREGMGEIFACGIQNPGLWNPEFSSRDSEVPLPIEIWNPKRRYMIHVLDTWSEPKSSIRLDKSGLDNFLGFRELFRKWWIKASPCELEFFPVTSLFWKALPALPPPPPPMTHTHTPSWLDDIQDQFPQRKGRGGEGVKRLPFERTS